MRHKTCSQTKETPQNNNVGNILSLHDENDPWHLWRAIINTELILG